MADESKVQIGTSGEYLRTFEVETSAGTVHIEAIGIVDSSNTAARATVIASNASANAYGLTVRPATPDIGTWAYVAGGSGTATVPAGGRVLTISAITDAGIDGSVEIDGGDTIPLNSAGINLNPKGNLVAPTVVFSSTNSYFIEYVTG